MPASKIFTGYRALGYVSNHVPLAVRHHRKHRENYVITCVGKSFHTYNVNIMIMFDYFNEISVIFNGYIFKTSSRLALGVYFGYLKLLFG